MQKAHQKGNFQDPQEMPLEHIIIQAVCRGNTGKYVPSYHLDFQVFLDTSSRECPHISTAFHMAFRVYSSIITAMCLERSTNASAIQSISVRRSVRSFIVLQIDSQEHHETGY